MFTLTLHEAGGAYEVVSVYTIEEASACQVAWQRKHCVGMRAAGQFHGRLTTPTNEALQISLNGRVWRGKELVYDPFASQEERGKVSP